MTVSVVLADANILFSRTLRDYLLYADDEGAIEIHWSQEILDEMSRNLRARFGFSQADTDRLEALMNDYIETALVSIEPDDLELVEAIEMDAKDRHVLAAAISVDADILLTDNVKHFPHAWMNDRGIELLNSATLLARLATAFPDELRAAHDKTVHYAGKSDSDVLAVLERIVGGNCADVVRKLVRQTGGSREPGADG